MISPPISPPPQPPKLLDRLAAKMRLLHYSIRTDIRTERAYGDWIKRFILFHGKRHPRAMGAAEIEAFLTHRAVVLAVEEVRVLLVELLLPARSMSSARSVEFRRKA